jgi:hypothetical protein
MRCSNLGPWSSATTLKATLGFRIYQKYHKSEKFNKSQKLEGRRRRLLFFEFNDDFEAASSCTLNVSGLSLRLAGCAGRELKLPELGLGCAAVCFFDICAGRSQKVDFDVRDSAKKFKERFRALIRVVLHFLAM